MNRQINAYKGPPKALSQARISSSTNSTPARSRAVSPNGSISTTAATPDSAIDPSLLGDTLEEASHSSAPVVQSSIISETKSKRKRYAWIYRHMAGTNDMQTVFLDANGKEIWPCKYCTEKGHKKEYMISGGTANIEKHLSNHAFELLHMSYGELFKKSGWQAQASPES
jgi:hypothetical protein